jgi:hypothetical protein
MIDHAHFRTASMVDPYHRKCSSRERYELDAHREACAECSRYQERLLQFEQRLERALKVKVLGRAKSPSRVGRALPRSWGGPKQWLALAASLLLGVAVVSGGWLAAPSRSLAADVVTHVAEEPLTEAPVAATDLQKVLHSAEVRLLPSAGIVTYANACTFRGYTVPHLVLQSARGPVTVMVLVHESVKRTVDFNEGGYRGVIVPFEGHGSVAILAPAEHWGAQDISDTVERVRSAVSYLASPANS